jgi:hypothetical protein
MDEINEIEIKICNICGLADQPCAKYRRQCRSCLSKRSNAALKAKDYYINYNIINRKKFAIKNKKQYQEKKALEISA